MKIYTNDLVKGHSDFKVKCLTFGLYTQVSDSGPLGPLVLYSRRRRVVLCCAFRPSVCLDVRLSVHPLAFGVRSITLILFKIFS